MTSFMDYIDLNDVARMETPSSEPHGQEPAEARADGNTCFRVLVVDDSAVMRRMLQEALLAANYRVDTCVSADDARSVIEKDPPHIVVSDWQMPGMNGPDFCRWLRQQSLQQYIYFVMISAHNKSLSAADGLTCGADDYVQKPIQMGELLTSLHNGQRVLNLHRRLKSPAQNHSSFDVH